MQARLCPFDQLRFRGEDEYLPASRPQIDQPLLKAFRGAADFNRASIYGPGRKASARSDRLPQPRVGHRGHRAGSIRDIRHADGQAVGQVVLNNDARLLPRAARLCRHKKGWKGKNQVSHTYPVRDICVPFVIARLECSLPLFRGDGGPIAAYRPRRAGIVENAVKTIYPERDGHA